MSLLTDLFLKTIIWFRFMAAESIELNMAH